MCGAGCVSVAQPSSPTLLWCCVPHGESSHRGVPGLGSRSQSTVALLVGVAVYFQSAPRSAVSDHASQGPVGPGCS